MIEQLVVSVNGSADGSGERIASLKSGDRVELLERSGEAVHVRLPDGTRRLAARHLSSPAMQPMRTAPAAKRSGGHAAERAEAEPPRGAAGRAPRSLNATALPAAAAADSAADECHGRARRRLFSRPPARQPARAASGRGPCGWALARRCWLRIRARLAHARSQHPQQVRRPYRSTERGGARDGESTARQHCQSAPRPDHMAAPGRQKCAPRRGCAADELPRLPASHRSDLTGRARALRRPSYIPEMTSTRRSDFDVTNTVQVSSPQAVLGRGRGAVPPHLAGAVAGAAASAPSSTSSGCSPARSPATTASTPSITTASTRST